MRLGRFGWAVCLAAASAAGAQDTRQVTEPVIPATCVKLEAKMTAAGDSLAAADEERADSGRIQEAINGFSTKCKPGTAVELAPSGAANAFLSGPLELREGETLLIDKGVTLFASRRASDYDVTPGACGIIQTQRGRGCKPFITIRAKHTAIMGDGVIDGRGGSKLLDKGYSWWDLAVKAEPENLPYGDPRLIDAAGADGLVLYRITLHNSPNFHVGVSNTNGFTAWGVHLKTPTRVPGPGDARPRNTDGIDPGSSTNVTITKSWIDNGDDNVAIKTGTTHMSVLDNHFYSGHGMSIGSETNTGVSYLLVDGLTEDHTTSGIRIKSNVTRGGLVHDLTYKNICMRNVEVPIAISPYYNNGTIDQFFDPGLKGTLIPDFKSIRIEKVYDETPGDVLIAGNDAAHLTEVTLSDVRIKGIQPAQVHLNYDDLRVMVPWSNIPFLEVSRNNKTVHMMESAGNDTEPIGGRPDPCVGKFLPMQ